MHIKIFFKFKQKASKQYKKQTLQTIQIFWATGKCYTILEENNYCDGRKEIKDRKIIKI